MAVARPEHGEQCDHVLAGYESHSGHQCVVEVTPIFESGFRIGNHEGRHQCSHGKDGGWRRKDSHTP